MAIQSFTDLKTAITDWVADTTIDDYLNDVILIAEKRLQRDIRIRELEVTFSETMSSGEVDIPTFVGEFIFNELKHARLDVAGGQPLEVSESGWLYDHFPNRTSTARPLYIATDADKFIFGPFPDAEYTVNGTYFKRPQPLSGSNATNEFTDNVPDALFFACLAETAPLLKDDSRVSVWESKYNQIKQGYEASNKRQMRRRNRTRYEAS